MLCTMISVMVCGRFDFTDCDVCLVGKKERWG